MSEQFQIDCGCCGGCGGGQAKNVIDLVVERGSPRQADYPYLGHNGKLLNNFFLNLCLLKIVSIAL